MRYYFDWNPPRKATANLNKYKIGFDQGTTIFLDKNAITIFDDDHSENEDRWITIGMDANGLLLMVIHTFHQLGNNECKVRIISVRRATKQEIKQYGKDLHEKRI